MHKTSYNIQGGNTMNYSAMIQNRKSVRAFKDKKVPQSVVERIETYYRTAVKRLIPQLETKLYVFRDDVKSSLEGAAGYHQFLVGAPQYLVLLSAKDERAELNAGYIMEDMVLNLTDMDLDTCWVTFTDSELVKASLGIESSMDVAAVVAFGYGEKTTKRLRLNMKSMSNVDVVAKHRYMEPKRSLYDMVFLNTWGNTKKLDEYIGFFDDILWESFYGASLAPSYLNRQAYGFVIHNGGISLVSRPDVYNTEIDGKLSLGIVLLHFAAVVEEKAGAVQWRFDAVADGLQLPEEHKVVATAVL